MTYLDGGHVGSLKAGQPIEYVAVRGQVQAEDAKHVLTTVTLERPLHGVVC